MILGGIAAGGRLAEPHLNRPGHPADRGRAPRAGELAWIALIPCALIVVVLIVALGPVLGRLLFPRSGLTFWPALVHMRRPEPEPTKHARYLLALTGPLLLSGAVVLGARRATPMAERTIALLVRGTQVLALLFVATCYVIQHRYVFHLLGGLERTVFFRLDTIAAAAVIACVIGTGVASERVRRTFAALTGESRRRRILGTGVALAATVVWLLPAINTERTIGGAHQQILENIGFWLDEVFAVLDGRGPLVHFAAQYGSLWPYPIAGTMALFGTSIGTFTIATSTISAVAMLALFATLRRAVRSTIASLLLFLPVLATSFFMMEGPLSNRYAIGNLFGTFPMRYAGPFLLLWMLARHLDGAAPRRTWPLFFAAGLVILNNVDFGVPAFGATLAALLWSDGRPTRRRAGRLALDAASGLLGAFAFVSALTLATESSLPHLGLLIRYVRLFAVSGFGMLPMRPLLGVSTAIYLTYVATVVIATVRAIDGERARLMTGLLAWSGVFGLGIGSYYMGRSFPEVLANMFAAWALSVALLFVLAVRAIAARASCRPTLAEAACLFAFGLLVCSLAQVPTTTQVSRLQKTGIDLFATPPGQPFVALHTHKHERVALLMSLGHRTAYQLRIVDVTPYTGAASMPTVDQLDEMLADLRAEGGRKVFLSRREAWEGMAEALVARGYPEVAAERFGMFEFARPG